MSEAKFNWKDGYCIISYDLSNNDISAREIANESQKLNVTVAVAGKSYDLPNTTLLCGASRDAAKVEFIRAFNATDSRSTISHLFVTEVGGKPAYVKDDK